MAPELVLRWLASCTVGVLLSLAALPAEAAQANLVVSARVLKHARLSLLTQPSSLVITAGDIGRGYVDVATPTQLAIQSNSPDGYAIEFTATGDFVRQISVVGLGGEIQLSPAGGVVIFAPTAHGVATVALRLGFRFALDAAVKPGTYAWPMQMSMTPL